MSCVTVLQEKTATITLTPNPSPAPEPQPNKKRLRRSSSALYEVHRKDSEVCYLYVPDEYDLVKSHLMFAVREEVEVLKDKISELMERIGQLEHENSILRAHATPETLAQVKQHTLNCQTNKLLGRQRASAATAVGSAAAQQMTPPPAIGSLS